MSQTYNMTINGQHVSTLAIDDLKDLDIIAIEPNTYHLIKNDKSYHIRFIKNGIEEKHYKIEINHRNYEVKIDDELDQLIKKMGLEKNSAKKIIEIHAPMPGLILDVIVQEGQTVNENDPLLILEAMKMENSVVSPRNGIINKIEVSKGVTVDKGQVLIVFDE